MRKFCYKRFYHRVWILSKTLFVLLCQSECIRLTRSGVHLGRAQTKAAESTHTGRPAAVETLKISLQPSQVKLSFLFQDITQPKSYEPIREKKKVAGKKLNIF